MEMTRVSFETLILSYNSHLICYLFTKIYSLSQ